MKIFMQKSITKYNRYDLKFKFPLCIIIQQHLPVNEPQNDQKSFLHSIIFYIWYLIFNIWYLIFNI